MECVFRFFTGRHSSGSSPKPGCLCSYIIDMAQKMATHEQRLNRWPSFSMLEPEFLASIKMACVFGGAGNEAIVVTVEDEVFSLGPNCSGCLGVADGRGGLQPRKIEGLSKKEVCWFAFGSGPHVLALTSKGKMYSWGHNGYSQLGLGSVNQGILPALVTAGLGESRIIQIACGSHHSLALSSDGEVFAWGCNNNGQIGSGSATNQTVPLRVQANIGSKMCISVACGQTSSTALTSTGELYTWGNNGNGQLGVGNNSNQHTPVKVVALRDYVIKQVVCGYAHTLALTDTGIMFAWGSNSYGQLGTGNKSNVSSPTQVVHQIGCCVEIAASHYNHVSAALFQNGAVCMWGQCRGQPILSPLQTRFDSLDDVFACFASPASMWRPLVLDPGMCGSLVTDMWNAFDNQTTSDVAIVVEDKKIHVHKAVLKIRCEHFRSMFQEGHWTEADKNEITITQFTYPVYHAFLRYLYTDNIQLPAEEALGLLDLATSYCEERLKEKCEEVIKHSVTVDNAAMLFEAATKYKAQGLANFCFQFAMNHMTEITQSESFMNLEESTVKLFIKQAAQCGAFRT